MKNRSYSSSISTATKNLPVKLVAKLLLLISLAASLAYAQTPAIQHVIVIIQENRTPENLFNQDTALANNGGYVQPPNNSGYCYGSQIALKPFNLSGYCSDGGGVFDPDHSHQPSWNNMWHKGAMDRACDNDPHIYGTCNGLPNCSGGKYPHCAAYTYVDNKVLSGYHAGSHILDPYFNIAANYGFANWMFQTNQGPSFPAHQFLLSGTSAPDTKSDQQGFYQWFAAENPQLSDGSHTPTTGCAFAPIGEYVWEVDSSGNESKGYAPPEPWSDAGYPCYNHPTLVDTFPTGFTWKYYNQGPAHDGDSRSSIWTAPNAIYGICQPNNGECTGSKWANVIMPGNHVTYDASPILDDLGANGTCNLPAVSWVIPDGFWSDHPGTQGADGGPGWGSGHC